MKHGWKTKLDKENKQLDKGYSQRPFDHTSSTLKLHMLQCNYCLQTAAVTSPVRVGEFSLWWQL